ncbi:hypothetical protein [Vampirovibrio sp.]|uniref:hypothetical protein n=1 Tax=Vampirovibrio sp. TaxID=2717857 RepID=UPI0035936B34
MFVPPDFYHIGSLGSQVPDLIEDLKEFDPKKALAILASLLVRQEYQPNTLRLETLTHLVTVYCNGKRPPKKRD